MVWWNCYRWNIFYKRFYSKRAKIYKWGDEDGIKSDLTSEQCEEIRKTVKRELNALKVFIGLDDLGDHNVGMIDDQPVIIDYGW